MLSRDGQILNRSKVAEIIACLMWGPKTMDEIVSAVGSTPKMVRGWLSAYHASGIVRIAGRKARANGGQGATPLLYAIQPTPFAEPDAVKQRRKPTKGTTNEREQASIQNSGA